MNARVKLLMQTLFCKMSVFLDFSVFPSSFPKSIPQKNIYKLKIAICSLPVLGVWIHIPLSSQQVHHLWRVDEHLGRGGRSVGCSAVPFEDSALLPVFCIRFHIALPAQRVHHLWCLDEYLSPEHNMAATVSAGWKTFYEMTG